MNAPIDFPALKARQQTAWASGDYAVIGTTLQIVGESLAEACDVRSDEHVLDVAAGNGNATARGGAPRCQGDLNRLRAGAPRAWRRARARRASRGRRSKWPTPRRCPSPTRASMPCCRRSA